MSQDNTFTKFDDVNVCIACAKGAGYRQKHQVTMHIFINAGKEEDRDGYTALVGRGKILLGKRFSTAERVRTFCVGQVSASLFPKECEGQYGSHGTVGS